MLKIYKDSKKFKVICQKKTVNVENAAKFYNTNTVQVGLLYDQKPGFYMSGCDFLYRFQFPLLRIFSFVIYCSSFSRLSGKHKRAL